MRSAKSVIACGRNRVIKLTGGRKLVRDKWNISFRSSRNLQSAYENHTSPNSIDMCLQYGSFNVYIYAYW